jgi:NAD(P)H-hydrate repair Nnr-like enzyme with NAD(P)H-hydrate dehydratase domain
VATVTNRYGASKKLNIHIVLKNDYTITLSPEGQAYFNSSGNAAMASGGMGDVLTGIIAACWLKNIHLCKLALLVFIHGKAGDELALPNRLNVVLPGKLTAQLPITMAKLIA